MLAVLFLHTFVISSSFGVGVPETGHNSLLNRHIKVAAHPWTPFIMFYCNGKKMVRPYECPNKGNITYAGVLWEFLEWVKSKRNITFSILKPSDPTWGICHGVNNCTGMIGMVNRREVDFSIGMFINNLTLMKCVFLESRKKNLTYVLRSFYTNHKPSTSC